METGGAKWRVVGSSDSSIAKATVTKKWSAKKFFGLGGPATNNANLRGSGTSDPSELAFGMVWVQSVGTVTDPPAYNVTVVMTFYAKWTEPKIFDTS